MSEQQEVQPVIITIDEQDYDMNEQSDASKEHYVEVVNLRREIADLQNQIATAQRRAINLQVALGFRENALRESIKVVEEEAEEVVGVDYAGDDLEIGFNVSYLLDVLNVLKGEGVRLTLSDSSSSALVEDAADGSAVYVVMPMRL